MPRPLRQQQPSSSVARLLDLDAAARAVASPKPVPENDEEAGDSLPAWGESPNIKRELVLTQSTDDTFTRLVDLYRRSTGTRLTTSHVARAVMKGVAHCIGQLEIEIKKVGRQKLPSNARGRELERERFEARLADAFVAGIRSASAFDPKDP
jgi:hypothetical protein